MRHQYAVTALTSTLPLESANVNAVIAFDGEPIPPIGQRQAVLMIDITPEYFRSVETPILTGRAFNFADNETSPLVAIVNSTFAKRFFAGDAVGRRFKTNAGGKRGEFKTITVVGIVDDVRHGSLEHDVEPEVFRPITQGTSGWTIKLVLRTSENPALLANAMRAAVTAVDARQPVFDVQTMDQRISDIVARRRLIMLLIACFAMLAVVLSAVGVYGGFSYSVNQRAHEMGIHLALGASRGGLLRLIVMQAARLIAMGGILGVGTALALSKLLSSLLVGVTPHDAVSFSLAWALMTVVALLVSTIPAADAARADLVSVLHSE
jgi:hypothetical protein